MRVTQNSQHKLGSLHGKISVMSNYSTHGTGNCFEHNK